MTENTDPALRTGGTSASGETLRERVARARAGVVEAINGRVPGEVTLHYKSRDVVIAVPGEVALRMMTVFRRHRSDGLADTIDLGQTLALEPWATVNMKGLLAISWDPGPDAAEAVGPELLDLIEALEEPAAAVAKVGKMATAEAETPESSIDRTDAMDAPADLAGTDADPADVEGSEGPGPTQTI